MSTGRKVALAIACVVIGFVLAAVFIAPRFIQINQYRPDVVSYIEQQTGRRVSIGHMALGILPEIAIYVDNFALGNPPGFPSGNWLAVKRIDASLDFGALLQGHFLIRALKLEHPVVSLLADQQGRWNFQAGPPRGPVRLPPGDPPLFTVQAIINLTLASGEATARTLEANGEPGEYEWTAHDLSLNLGRIDAAELNALGGVPATGPAQASAGSATGRLSIASLSVLNVQASTLESNVQVSPAQLQLNGLQFDIDGGHCNGTVSLQFGNAPVHYQVQAGFNGVNMVKLLAGFPSARGQMTGTLDGLARLSGRQTPDSQGWEDQQGEGNLTIRNGSWPKLKLDPNLVQLMKLAQLGPTPANLSAFSSISANWRLAAGTIRVPEIRIVSKGAKIDGSGTVDLAHDDSLDFHGVMTVAAHRNTLSNFLAAVAGGKLQAGKMSVPFVVRGTANKPALGLAKAPQFGPGPQSNSSH
jgi:uncharacterized protein involved in outer membrane biogenesis